MRLPPPSDDLDWSRVRRHDLEERWDASLAPHLFALHAARFTHLQALCRRLVGPGQRVLDVGCAQGTLGLLLAEQGLAVDLLDAREGHIAYARARHERGEVGFHVGHLGPDLPPRRDYDLVICTEVLEHVPAPGALLEALRDKARPGGAVLLTTPNADYALGRLPSYGEAAQRVIDEAEPDSADGDAHRYLFTREELVSLCRGAGLRVEETGFFLPLWVEGHLKTRHLHRALFRLRGVAVEPTGALPAALAPLARRLCSSQWLIARRPGSL